ncbi:hypothetical protein LJK88_34510 [Paenibacillus sp. P26]|nr:hypothetical protein LJK88_34510 [Paenibacillus sp. P26]UUZ93805.1 hypothetical protein LJK87_03670 [Paenibacillus sp. P25]
MKNVKNAEFKRILERNDRLCADVEVELEGEPDKLVALFAEAEDNDLDMVMVLRKEADTDVDWYDNNLHAAYVDVTVEMFADRAGETHWGPREKFKEQVLGFGNVRERIHKALSEARMEKAEA